MKSYIWILFIFFLMSATGVTYGRGKPQDSPINAAKCLLETLINADDEQMEKLDILEKKFGEQSEIITELKDKLVAAEQTNEAQQNKITEIENDLLAIEQKYQNQLNEQNNKISELQNFRSEIERYYDNNRVVAFSARVSPSYADIAPWATIKFSKVDTNIGDAYDNNTGEFTAPRGGTYVFYSNILTKDKSCVETALLINGEKKLLLYSAGATYFGAGGNMLVAHLSMGDNVKMVKHGPWGAKPFYIHSGWSTFSGFLLRSDDK